MEGSKKQAVNKSINYNCKICGNTVLGSIYKLKQHLISRHSNIKHPNRCKKCGNKYNSGRLKHQLPDGKCRSTTIDKDGLKEMQDYQKLRNKRWIDLNKEFDSQKRDREDKEKLNYVRTYLVFTVLRCDVCEIDQFESSLGVSRHVELKHGPQIMLSCKESACSEKTLTSQFELKKHIKNCHKSSHICEDCGKSYDHLKGLKTHKGVHHKKWKIKVVKVDSNAKLIRDLKEDCRCNIEFSGKKMSFLKRHFQQIHLGYEQCVQCKKIVIKQSMHTCKPKWKSNIKLVQCELCPVVKTNTDLLKNHVQRVHNPETMVKCKFCIKLLTERDIKYHSCQGRPLPRSKCDICGKMVARLEIHKNTMHISNDDKRIKCEHCNKGFFDRTHLKSHTMNVHLKLRPFKCRYGCDQDYNDRSNMRQHEKRAHGVLGPRVQMKLKNERCDEK